MTNFPSRDEILDFIRRSPKRAGRREVARAFGLDKKQTKALSAIIKELKDEGLIEGRRKGRKGRNEPREKSALPPVTVIEVSGVDADGEVMARPLNWDRASPPPDIYLIADKSAKPAPGPGDRILAKLRPAGDGVYEARAIRRLAGGPGAPRRVLGIYAIVDGQGRIRPTDKKVRSEVVIETRDSLDAKPGDLIRAEIKAGKRLGLMRGKIIERLAATDGAKSISMITLHDHDIPVRFAEDALNAAKAAGPAPTAGREDLRAEPLVTIDGADARDFDDAVMAVADSDPKNPGGWLITVAIADVAWYARPGEPLDRAAYERGNSVYLPDRVTPMLPEKLSNGWCSLVEGEDRPCMAVHMKIDAAGKLLEHSFTRAVMRSRARLTYEAVQAARDGKPDAKTRPLNDAVIAPLYGAFDALARGRAKRGALELEIPEQQIIIGDDGSVAAIEIRERFASHKLIEEFMIAANVAAAETIGKLRIPCMYRVHDEPPQEKLESLRQFLDTLGIRLARGQVTKAELFNRILARAKDKPYAHMVGEVVLRSQSQAEYSPGNIGHFGLALRNYAHFTSPIRRYADLLVHRALIRGLKLGPGGLEKDHRDFTEMGEHISATERRATSAERSARDRFTAAYLSNRIGTDFTARISGVTRFGLFVTLDDIGGDGLIPIRTMSDDYYIHDEGRHLLKGRRNGRQFCLGDGVAVTLTEANPLTGGMVLELTEPANGGAPVRGQKGEIFKPKKGGKKRKSGRKKPKFSPKGGSRSV